jgi:lysophospholipase L1-like esterase
MLNRRSLIALALTALCVSPLLADDKPNPAATPAEKDPRRHQDFLKEIERMHGKIDVVFLGDSITDGWRGQRDIWNEHFGKFHPLNLGIGGDRTQHVLWRIQHDELKGYNPKAFVIMIGTNNMGSDSEQHIADGVKAIISEIEKQHPAAKILLLGIFPRSPKASDPIRGKVKRTNEILAKFDDGKKVKYLDFGQKFLTDDGTLTKEIMPDFLHLSKKGYEIWAENVEKELEEMTK